MKQQAKTSFLSPSLESLAAVNAVLVGAPWLFIACAYLFARDDDFGVGIIIIFGVYPLAIASAIPVTVANVLVLSRCIKNNKPSKPATLALASLILASIVYGAFALKVILSLASKV